MPERQQAVLEILKNLRGLDPLKELLWTQFSYQRINQSLSRSGWTETAARALSEDPVLFAGGGQGNAFHVIYARLASDQLPFGLERPVVSRMLREHPYVLFVFSNATQDQWHFLNVKHDSKSEKRRLYRRITVGRDERLRTASERLSILDLASVSPDLLDLSPLAIQQRHDDAFDVEAVQRDFFRAFADLYHKVAEDIRKTPGLDAKKLAQLLLDRLLFLYFIQKKGWLDQELDYLYSRFQQVWRKDPEGHSYYSDVLYPLFLCLSDPNQENNTVGAVPFLNGGLFEESARQTQTERLAHARLTVKNSTFKEIFEDLLERFNFTVTEDTPLDVEVAIDPEMLGKVFESLILQLEKDPDKDLRKLTGSYYTPRAIVHFMGQEALKEYLVTQLSGGDSAKAANARGKVEKLVSLPPADHLDDEQQKALKELFTEAEAKMLRQAILDCSVCDPAVGSGAFPVGMLHEMVAVIARLDLRLHGRDFLRRRNYDYDLKKRIIEYCLYGVDIQEQAVRLCELRLWLSLVVDYQIASTKAFAEAIREIPSLPNLSYRIVRGDSLLERLFGHVVRLDEMAKDAKTKQLIDSIQADKQAYFIEGNTTEKRRLELKILAKQAELAEHLIGAKRTSMTGYQANLLGDEASTLKDREARAEHEKELKRLADLAAKVARVKSELERLARSKEAANRGDLDALRRQYFHTGSDPTFIWCVDFAEVFREKEGFDIVVANPPYLSFGLRDKKQATQDWANSVRRYYPGSAEYKISAYALFLDLGLQIAAKRGVACFITPDSYLLGRYFSKLRQTILRVAAVKKVIMFEKDFWKSGVVGRPTISLLQRNAPAEAFTATLAEDESDIEKRNFRQYTYHQDYFRTVPHNRFRLFFSPMAKAFVEAIEANGRPLRDYARITTGVRSKSGQENVIATHPRGSDWKRGLISGSQVQPYRVEWRGHYLHISGGALFSGGWDRSLVERPKILIRQTGDTIIAAIDSLHLYHLNNVHTLAPLGSDTSLAYLCALLNSRLMNRYYHLISLEYGRAMAQTDIETLELLPVREPDRHVIAEIEALVKRMEDANGQKDLQRDLDGLIEQIYDMKRLFVEYLDGSNFYPEVSGNLATEVPK